MHFHFKVQRINSAMDSILGASLENNLCCDIQMSQHVRKRTFWHVRPTKSQLGLRIHTVWSEPSMSARENIAFITKTRLFKYIENFSSQN